MADRTADLVEELRRSMLRADTLARRLARHEYAALRGELADLTARWARGPSPQRPPSDLPVLPEARLAAENLANLPVLPVPVGWIAAEGRAERLSVMAVAVPEADTLGLGERLADLFEQLHPEPFSRVVFLLRDRRLGPFLARYGLVYHYIGEEDPVALGPVLAGRYGLSEIRNLMDGAALWRSSAEM